MKRHLRHFCWTVLSLAPLPAVALSLEVTPAWGGFVSPHAATEIGVRVVADYGGRLELQLIAGTVHVRHAAELTAGVPLEVWLPLRVDAGTPVMVEARLATDTPLTRMLMLKPLERPLVAVLQTEPNRALSSTLPADDGPLVLHLGAAALPHSQAGYETIAALVAEPSALGELTAVQLSALQGYLGSCGPMVLLHSTEELLATLQRSAGCRGHHVRAASTLAMALSINAELLQQRPTPPDTTVLQALATAASRPYSQIGALTLFFAGYGCVLVLLVCLKQRPMLLLTVPVAAAALCLLAWLRATPASWMLSWAELDSGDTAARFAVLLRIEGRGRATTTLTVNSRFGMPSPTETGQLLEINQQLASRLTVNNYLLSRQEFVLRGSVIVKAPLALELTNAGPVVVNIGRRLSARGVLAWQGRRYVIPELLPGMHWTPSEQTSDWDSGALDHLLRARSAGSEAALLVPYPELATDLAAGTAAGAGWLLIKSGLQKASS